jgi:hypothetical protein
MAADAPAIYESSVFNWRLSDRPAQRDRGPDCFVSLLISFLFVDLKELTPGEFAAWIHHATDALRTLHRLDLWDPIAHSKPSGGPTWWLTMWPRSSLATPAGPSKCTPISNALWKLDSEPSVEEP